MSAELVIVGAGPAGMAAAALAAEHGARVMVLDEQPAPGGQIWRGIETVPESRARLLGPEYLEGRAVAARFRAADIDYRPSTTVWSLADDREICFTDGKRATMLRPDAILLATGAQERPVPVPGWTLPGVITAGGAQILLKTGGLAAGGAVLAGCGPLLYVLAVQYLRAGAKIAALLDTTAPGTMQRAMAALPGALSRPGLLRKGLGWQREIRRSGVNVVRHVASLAIEGDGQAEAVAWRCHDGTTGRQTTGHVVLHQGIVPSVNLSMAAGLAHDWDTGQLAWRPRLSKTGLSSAAGIWVSGDGGGIDGAVAAGATGALAALDVLGALGKVDEGDLAPLVRPLRRQLGAERRIRPFLDAWFRPADAMRVPPDHTTPVCRCEEITLGDLEDALATGLTGPNQLKSLTRAGMGPCQGRFCGLTVAEIVAARTGQSMAETGYLRLRPPVKPITLAELADMETPDGDG